MAGSSDAGELVQQLFSLWQQGMDTSTRILGDLLLSNTVVLGLKSHPEWHLVVLLTYADSLYEDRQCRRALCYYKEALKVHAQLSHLEHKGLKEGLPSEGEIKWKMYKSHMQLKEPQEALDVLSGVPLKQRDAKIALALAKLYHHFKKDSKCALICYKQVVSMCPLALEAVLALLSLGMTMPEIVTVSTSKVTSGQASPLVSAGWLAGWLEAQAYIAKHDYKGAVAGFENLTKMGFVLSAETNSQLGWCMTKLGRKSAADELFTTARVQDRCILKHMDSYARVLGSSKKLERLSSELLYASAVHPEPWIAKAWQQTRNKDLLPSERAKAVTFIHKANSISPRNAEAAFLQASLSFAKQDIHAAVQRYSEAVQVDPTFFDAYEALIRCYLMVRSDKEAVNMARVAAKHIQQPALQYYLEGVAFSQKPTTVARAKLLFEKAAKADKTFEKAPVTLSNMYVHEGDTEKAVEVLSKHLEIHSSPLLHTELANCLVRLKRYQEAMDQYGLALCQDPGFDKALQGIENLQKLNSSDLDDTGSIGGGSELEDEDILIAGGLEDALEYLAVWGAWKTNIEMGYLIAVRDGGVTQMDSDDSIPVMDLANPEYQW